MPVEAAAEVAHLQPIVLPVLPVRAPERAVGWLNHAEIEITIETEIEIEITIEIEIEIEITIERSVSSNAAASPGWCRTQRR